MAHYEEEKVGNDTRDDPAAKDRAAHLTFEKVLYHYEKSAVPMQLEKNCRRKIRNLYEIDYYKNIRSINYKRREQPFAIKKVHQFNQMLDKTMPFWPKNVISIINSICHPVLTKDQNLREDTGYFQSMLTDRQGRWGGKDNQTRTLTKS